MGRHFGKAAVTLVIALLTGVSAPAETPTLAQTADTLASGVGDTVGGVLDVLTPQAAAPTPAEVEQAFLALTNKERVARGLRPLSMSAELVAVARRQSRAMADANELWHNTAIVRQLTGWEALGENVGRGPSVQHIHVAFMESPHHRVNILDRGFTLVGMGAVVYPDGYIYITQDFEEPKAATVSSTAGATPSRSTTSAARAAPRAPAPPDRAHVVDVLLRLIALDAKTARPARGET